MRCFACSLATVEDFDDLAQHFFEEAADSDPDHVMWLNRNITKKKVSPEALAQKLQAYHESTRSLGRWIKTTFIHRFLGERPHPFVIALQHPTRPVILGYVLEHQHFLRQWVRSCASVIAKTDKEDVILYEIDNIATEFGGIGPEQPSHHELLIRMGESQGLSREEILATEPLPKTQRSLETWREMAEKGHWLETMAAMHTLEMIANRELRREGASIGYFDPAILASEEVHPAVKAFLREGYEADVGHSEEALALVEKYAQDLGMEEEVRSAVMRSLDAFDTYLDARLERAKQYEGT